MPRTWALIAVRPALGIDGLLLDPRAPTRSTGVSVRVSMGHILDAAVRRPLRLAAGPRPGGRGGLRRLRHAADDAVDLGSLDPVAHPDGVVLGAEGPGVTPEEAQR